MRILLICAVVLGCSDKLQWKEHKLHTVEIGGLRFEIPKGWRDLSESTDPKLARVTRRLGSDADAHMIVRESDPNTNTNISFMLAELVGAPTCDQWAAAMAMRGGKIERQTVLSKPYGTDRGCSFWIKEGKSDGKIFIRFRGDKFVTLQCLWPAQGDTNAMKTCDDLETVLAAQ